MPTNTFAYELFIVHADADRLLIRDDLVPALGVPLDRVLWFSKFELGYPIVSEIERGVRSSRLTVVAVTPRFLADGWAMLAEQIAGHPERAGGRLIPLWLLPCELPPRLEVLTKLDFRDRAQWAIESQRLRDRLDQPLRELVEPPCPYPGMRPYSAATAAYFHGRDQEVEDIVGRLRAGEREIYVIGPSGSGKSSLVIAGVLPRLERSELAPLVVRTLQPGELPATRLAQELGGELGAPAQRPAQRPAQWIDALLAAHGAARSVVIVIDQLEELFIQASEAERAQFLAALRGLRTERRCLLILSLRADFFGALMESALWSEIADRLSRVEVATLRGAALREAIERPAHELGVPIEPELVERLLADAAAEPGILPLLQETLVQLWERRRPVRLTLADYEALGDGSRSGLAVAIGRRADATLRKLTRGQTRIAQRILIRLVSFGTGRADTRRQQPRGALRAADDAAGDFDAVLRQLIDDRLLTIHGDGDDEGASVDLAHEVMISAWPALAGWIRTHHADERRRRRLEAAAAEWIARDRNGGLLDAVELAEAEAWLETDSARQLGDSSQVKELVAVSKATLDEAARRQRAAHDELVASRRHLRHVLARSYQEEARQLVLEGQPLKALPYLVTAREEGAEGSSLGMLFRDAMRIRSDTTLVGHAQEVVSIAISPDGTRVVSASHDHSARIWDIASGRLVTPRLMHDGPVNRAWFSPDGMRVVTVSQDRAVRIWDARTGVLVAGPLLHRSRVNSAQFSSDGHRIVTASEDGTAAIWDAATGARVGRTLEHKTGVASAVFDPDATRVATASWDHARIWNAATGRATTRKLAHDDVVTCVAFSAGGDRLATASQDGGLRVWDTDTGKLVTERIAHDSSVICAAFSPDGARIVTAGEDRAARVWDAATGALVALPCVHLDAVYSAEFSRDGRRILTASRDTTVRVWDAVTGDPVTPPLKHEVGVTAAAFAHGRGHVVTATADNTVRIWDVTAETCRRIAHHRAVYTAEFSRDGTRIVTASADGTARIWDAATAALIAPLVHRAGVNSAVFDPTGRYVVTASSDHTACVWRADTGELALSPLVHDDIVNGALFSRDGSIIVTASSDGTARIWDATTGAVSAVLAHDAVVTSVALCPKLTCIVTASDDKGWIWDLRTGELRTRLIAHTNAVECVAISPDGTRVVTGSWDHTARIWDLASGAPLAPPLAHHNEVVGVAFSPDSARIVVASRDRTARIWDAATGRPITPPLAHDHEVCSAAFSPDGDRVVTTSRDRTARLWDAVTGKPVALAQALLHGGIVYSAAFHPASSQLVTASDDGLARIWDVSFDTGTLAEWSALVDQRSADCLVNGVLMSRALVAAQTGAGSFGSAQPSREEDGDAPDPR